MREAAPRAAEARQWPFRRTPLKGGEWGPEALRGHPSHREGGPLFLKKKKALMEGLLTRQKFESCEQNILGMAGSEINKRFDNLSAFLHFLSPVPGTVTGLAGSDAGNRRPRLSPARHGRWAKPPPRPED